MATKLAAITSEVQVKLHAIKILYKITVMKAQFFTQLAASHPVLRDHVRLGAETSASAANGTVSGNNRLRGVASSFAVLDAYLPWQGWPAGAMTEIMTDAPGCGELSLLLPAMARLTQQKRPILCIGAPHELFAPALAQTGVDPDYVTQIHSASSSSKHFKENLWSAEQALRTGLPGMVVLWTPAHSILTPEILRRLHLASLAGAGNAPAATTPPVLIHFRGASSMSQPSPAWLRFGYAADDAHIRLQIIKCRGRELTRPLITLDRAAVQARLYRQRVASQLLDSTVEFGITSLPHINAATQYASTTFAVIAANATHEAKEKSGRANTQPSHSEDQHATHPPISTSTAH
ncbi:MAG TPA: hypothetical protein PKJ50_07940 [Casimicrobium huifangae]|nr:hypothetical protein [Casimicrobium huifangae]